MLEPSAYIDREQTYVKHFVLEKYLERVAYNIFSFQTDFTYVDGFSGPWKSENERYEDTSFFIAIAQLRAVRSNIKDSRNKDVNFRCMFIEKAPKAFQELEETVRNIQDVPIELIHGSFEDNVSRISEFAKTSFSLIFIDPTGWQGFSLEKITPLLNLRGEVLINFMSNFIVRFLEDPRPEIASSFDNLFGKNWFSEWSQLHSSGLSREAAAIEVYTQRLKRVGNFKHVTSTRILKPKADRSYFYLIYATQHWKGVQEFRSVEKKAIYEQERLRNAAKYTAEVAKTGQKSLFGEAVMEASNKTYEAERETQLEHAESKLTEALRRHPEGIKYEKLIGIILETPLVWESDLKKWLSDLKQSNKVMIPEMTGKQRVPKVGYLILPT
ncbi:three-Cys-motif partner protein TcmP [Denitrobaculum tricleocarpae]|uniref:Three-Cys-motif partner protein TcmP n=1 Tax=Denitrobaculum tricleocarpae TaxID=2591009 RepID=A0A545SZ65_9PROT|nr:three-Cys-motif partner protein TcmP [Denitrobaculum tricleocarpae]TQV70257.1 three-Cys-motif partner protein TcmP [Denitrobaculum tricleocarpae]